MLRFFNSKYLFISFFIASLIFGQISKEKIDSINSFPYEYIISNLSETNRLFKQNVKDAESINYKFGKGKALIIVGLTEYLRGNYDKSSFAYLEAIKIFEELKNYKELSYVLGEFGYQMKLRNLPKAFEYMLKGIKIAEEHNFNDVRTALYNNVGVLYEMNNQLDSAKYYYEKSLEMAIEQNDSLSIPYSLNRIAQVYLIKKDFDSALKFLSRSDKIRYRKKGLYGISENLALRADIFTEMGKMDSAIVYYEKCIEASKELSYAKLEQYCAERLVNIFEKKRNFERAFYYLKKAEAIKDSIDATETNIRIADLELDYETAKKDKLLAENKLELRKQTSFLILISALFIFSIIVSYLIYRYQKMKRARLKTEMELETQIQKSEFEKKMTEEKLRISRELHDNIGAHLTFLISSLDNLAYTMKEKLLINKLASVSRFGRKALDELRTTIWAMNHEASNLKDLELKLNEFKRHIASANQAIKMEVINNVGKEISLSSAQNLNLFRIVQESVQNSLKYSRCKSIQIKFEETEDGFKLTIADDGCGFDVKQAENKRGNGLTNMEFRCKSAGGVFSIESDGTGTKIICDVKSV